MRKVDPKLDIPAKDLTDDAIKHRLFCASNRKIEPRSAKRLSRVAKAFITFNGDFDVATEMDKLYAAVDNYMVKNVYPNSVCRKGCGYCCAVPVDMALIEAARIAIYLDQELPDEMIRIVKAQKTTPCPFLGDDFCCTVYPVRPFSCRVFASLDSWHPCRDQQSHAQHNMRSQVSFETIIEAMEHYSRQAGTPLDSYGDIREYFGLPQG